MKQKLLALVILTVLFVLLLLAGLILIFYQPSKTDIPEDKVYAITDYSVADVGAIAVTNDNGTFGILAEGENLELVSEDMDSSVASQRELRSLLYAACHLTSTRQVAMDSDNLNLSDPNATITLLMLDGDRIKLTLFQHSPLTADYYLLSDSDGSIYLLDETVAELFLRRAQDLASHNLFSELSGADLDRVDRITVSSTKGHYSLVNEGSAIYLTDPIYQRVRSVQVISKLILPLSQLYGQTVVSWNGNMEEWGLDQPDLTVEMTVDGEVIQAVFRQEGNDYLIGYPHGKIVWRMSDATLNDLIPFDPLDLLDGHPYYYAMGDCTSITAVWNDIVLQFELSGSGEDITAKCGENILDSVSVAELSGILNGIEIARRSEKEEATDEGVLTLIFTLSNGSRETINFLSLKDEVGYAVQVNGIINFIANEASVLAVRQALEMYS